jgi:hypothetical protein
MQLHGEQKSEPANTRPLALRLIELAIAAGWKPRECIAFALEAHEFVMSTLRRADQQLAAGTPGAAEDAKETARSATATTERPKWGPDTATRRKVLQALADQNLMMREAAEILGVSHGVVATTAYKLKIRFHGRRGKRRPPTATPKATSKPTNGTPARPSTNGAAVARLLVPADRGLRRRCPSCNQVFEPAELSQYLCGDCESSSYAGPPRP